MKPKTYTVIEWIATGLEAIGIGITIAIGGKCVVPITAAFPIAKQAVCSICKLFVEEK